MSREARVGIFVLLGLIVLTDIDDEIGRAHV